MEQQINPVGGTWAQDSATSLRQLIVTAEKIISAIDTTTTAVNNSQTTVQMVQNVYHKPEYQFVYNPLPIITPNPKQRVEVVVNHIKAKPIVIDVNRKNAYGRVCGSYNPVDSRYSNCMECVDKWLEERKTGFELKDLTRSGTGCKVQNKYK
jgi:hypothetical protein